MPLIKQEWNRRQDVQLIRKAKEGDSKAFSKLVTKYQRQVYACIARMVFSHSLTDDLIQETFIKVFQSLYRFDESYPFYPWVRRIAVNTTLNRLKSEGSRKASFFEYSNPDIISDDNPVQDVEREEMLRNLKRAMQVLPEEQRIVFVLRTNDELSYEEIAKTLGISIGTVMSRLNRARTKLKTLFKDYL
jgi:RNA polymerase sigma-70 factor (ECF subfamily)